MLGYGRELGYLAMAASTDNWQLAYVLFKPGVAMIQTCVLR